jgi:hypothetical protein
VSLGICGAFDSTTFKKKAFPEPFLLSPLRLNSLNNCYTRNLRLADFGKALKNVLVGIEVWHELKGIRMIDSTPSSGARPQKD